MYNSCTQIEVFNVADTPLAMVPACSTYAMSVNPSGKKRRKRSDVINNQVYKALDKIMPSKVTSFVISFPAHLHALHRPPKPPRRSMI